MNTDKRLFQQTKIGNLTLKNRFIRSAIGDHTPGGHITDAILAKYQASALILNGTHDNVVPYNYAIRYSEVMPGAKLQLIDGENHGFTNTADTTSELIAEWLWKHSR